jgi:hypothetical protein
MATILRKRKEEKGSHLHMSDQKHMTYEDVTPCAPPFLKGALNFVEVFLFNHIIQIFF